MSSVRKGILSRAGVWAKHLRPYWKRDFWGRHRVAERNEIDDLMQVGQPGVGGVARSRPRRDFHVEYRWRDEKMTKWPWAWSGWKRFHTRYKTEKSRDQAMRDMNGKDGLFEYRAATEEHGPD